MESTAINTVYVVMSVNIDTDEKYLMKIFGNEQDALKYKEESYEYEEKYQDGLKHLYYILEEIVY